MTATSRLDELAEALLREVRYAAGARADAEVAAAFDGMTKELNSLAEQLESYGAVVSGPIAADVRRDVRPARLLSASLGWMLNSRRSEPCSRTTR